MNDHTRDRSQKPVTPPQSLRATSRDDAPSPCSRGTERPREAISGNTSRRRVSMAEPHECTGGFVCGVDELEPFDHRSAAARKLARLRAAAPETYHGEVRP